MGQLEQTVELIVGKLQHLQRLILVETDSPFENLLARLYQNVAHRSVSLMPYVMPYVVMPYVPT